MSNPYAPPQAAVLDIPLSGVGMEQAERLTRLGAAILDGIIFGAMVYLPMVLAFVAGGAAGAFENEDEGGRALIVGFGAALIGFIAWAWLTILYVKRNSQTIAKKITGIKVVRSDGSPISFGRLFWLRNVVNAIISIVPLYSIIDLLFIFGDQQQCLHDKLADSIVIKA